MLDMRFESVSQRFWQAGLAAVVVCSAILVGLTAAGHRWLIFAVLGFGGCLPLVVLLGCSPNLCTLAFLFGLYTNITGIVVNVYGLPMIVGAGFFLLLVPPLVHQFVMCRQPVIITPILPLVLLFILIQSIATVLSSDPSYSASYLFCSILEGLVLYFIVTNIVRTRGMMKQAIWVIVAAGAFLGAIGIFQYVTGNFGSNMGGFMQNPGKADSFVDGNRTRRLGGPVDSANVFAQIMLMIVPLAMFCCREPARRLRISAVVATGLISVCCLLTFSRGAAVAAAMMVTVAAIKGYIQFRYIVLIAIFAVFGLGLLPEYRQRIASIGTAKALIVDDGMSKPDSSIRGRSTEMISALIVFWRNPIIGVGPGMNKFHSAELSKDIGIRLLDKDRKSHSLYPDIAADYGIFGISCFLSILFLTLRNLSRTQHRCSKSDPELARMAGSFFLAIVAYMTAGIFIHFSFIRFFWLNMALANVTTILRPNYLSIQDAAR